MLRSMIRGVCLLGLLVLACDSPSPTKAETKTAKSDTGKSDANKSDTKAPDTKADTKAPDTKADTKAPDAKAPDAKVPGTDAGKRTWNFDDATAGKLPPGFQIAQRGEQAPPAKWAASSSDDAPSGSMTLAIVENSAPSKTFHVALAEGTSYGNVEIDVMIKATAGVNNRGGGVVFRAKGPDDYYVARWNPVEANFRVYSMLGGARLDLASATLELDEEAWHHLHVTMIGSAIKCSIDGEEIASLEDKALPDAGMVGVWAKGDAQTQFDDFSAKAL